MASSGEDRITWVNYDKKNHRPRMDKSNRAKIFLPFNALEGLYETLEEKETESKERIVLSEDEAQLLNEKLMDLKKGDYVTVTYYEPCSDVNSESYGSQGQYKTVTGICWNVDAEVTKTILVDEMRIRMEDIRSIESPGDIFKRNWEDQSADWGV